MHKVINTRYITENIEEDTRVYERVKAMVKTYELPPNTCLPVKQLSVMLAPSGEISIRAALLRLVREGLVVEIPQKGFFTKRLSSSEICELYELNEVLVEESLKVPQKNFRLTGIVQFSRIFSITNSKLPSEKLSPEKLAQMTNDFFIHLVTQSGRSDLIQVALNVNDRLNYVRFCEHTLIDFPKEELGYLCHLYHRKYIKELCQAVKEYHMTRFKLIPRLMEIL